MRALRLRITVGIIRRDLLRYVLPVAAAVSLVAFVGVPYIDQVLAGWFRSDVQLRASW